MALAALLIYLTGVLTVFGWRSLVAYRATGDSGLRLDAGPVGSAGWWAKVSFLAALALGLAGPPAALAGLPAVGVLDRTGLQWAGALTAVLGAAATLAAQAAMGSSWRVGVDSSERTSLVTDGVFGLSRNPFFTALLTTSAGLALMVPNVLSLLATTVLLVSVQVQVRVVEEPYLAATHGREYARYRHQVGRFVPWIGRTGAPSA